MIRDSWWMTLVLGAVLAVGCGQGPGGGHRGEHAAEPEPQSDPAALAEGKKYLLPGEPAGARGVIDVRKDAKDGEEVIVVGRVGGSSTPFTPGRTSFLIVDPSLKPAMECDCPWDFCETPSKELTSARLRVQFADAEGKSLKASAREAFGIKELSTVVVKGKTQRDDKGNVTLVGSGLFVRPETP
jgi:hypothetical protein